MIVDGAVVPVPTAPMSNTVVVEPVTSVPLRARAPHVKPGAITCADFSGPNMVRFKLREGVAAHFDESTRQIVADTSAALSAAASSDLARATSLGDYVASAFGRPAAEMRDLKARAEAESGEESPDLSLWFDLGVGARGVANPAATDRALCDRVANVVNELNALDSVEIAFARTTPSLPSIPFLIQASDIAPTTVAFSPPHLGPPSAAGGMNSPDYTGYLPTSWISAFRGSSVGVIDIEWDFTAHEKFNTTRVRDAANNEGLLTGQNTGHANASMGAAFGTARSAGVAGNPLYGTRGFAPEANRGFSGVVDWDFFLGQNIDVAEAVADAGDRAVAGDIMLIEVEDGCGTPAVPAMCNPIDYQSDVADCINTYSNLGRIYLVPMGNGFGNGGPGTDRGSFRRSNGIYIAANNADGLTQSSVLTRASYSNFGSLVDLNGWGSNVWTSASLDGTGGACWLPTPVGGGCGPTPLANQAYVRDFNGTSSASAVVTGALAQTESLYESIYSRRMGFSAARNAAVLRDTARTGATLVPPVGANVFGLQPDVYYTAMHVIPATRFGRAPGSTAPAGMLAPHSEFLTTTWPTSGAVASNSLYGSIRTTAPNAGVRLTERSVGMTTTGPLDLGAGDGDFSIAFRTYGISAPTSQFQIIVAKENPRNYSVALYPSSFGASAGKVEFSYLPQGSPYFCPVASNTSIADGGLHDVVIVFKKNGWYTPVIYFYIDGVYDAASYGCTTANATTNIGVDQSVATLAANMAAYSYVGDIRLYRRQLYSTEIVDYHNGAN